MQQQQQTQPKTFGDYLIKHVLYARNKVEMETNTDLVASMSRSYQAGHDESVKTWLINDIVLFPSVKGI